MKDLKLELQAITEVLAELNPATGALKIMKLEMKRDDLVYEIERAAQVESNIADTLENDYKNEAVQVEIKHIPNYGEGIEHKNSVYNRLVESGWIKRVEGLVYDVILKNPDVLCVADIATILGKSDVNVYQRVMSLINYKDNNGQPHPLVRVSGQKVLERGGRRISQPVYKAIIPKSYTDADWK